MSKVKYLEMEDIAYKEWSDHLDFVASTRSSPWLPAYGCHPPSPIQEIFQSQRDPFQPDNASGQQQYLVLETIVEETSDDLCSESDKSGPTGWNSDSDAESVIHLPKMSDVGIDWRERDCAEEVPKKRRCRIVDKLSFSDDDEPHENLESTPLSSRSSSLLAFESLEKHCEDIFVTTASSDPFGCGIHSEAMKWNSAKSPDSLGELKEVLESSDEECGFKSSVNTLYKSVPSSGNLRSFLPSDGRLRPYRSFDSLNLLENTSPLSYTMSELSQSQSALDYEKEKEQEKEFVIRNKKLTATTADLSVVTDSYEPGIFPSRKTNFFVRRKQDSPSFHYREPRLRNSGPLLTDNVKTQNYFSLPEGKSFSAEGLKLELPFVREISRDQSRDIHTNSEPCLSAPSGSLPSAENLSEDSGFDDHISAKGKSKFCSSAANVLEDEDSSPSEWSSSSRFSDSNGSEEGSVVSTKGHEHSKFVNKTTGLKINGNQESEARESFGASKNDVEVNFNPGQSEARMFNCTEEETVFGRGKVEKLIATPSVAFASLHSEESATSCCSFDIRPRPEFITFCKAQDLNREKKDTKSECVVDNSSSGRKKPNDLFYEAVDEVSAKMEKSNGGIGRQIACRLPVLSTPNLLVGDDVFVSSVPSAASSLTHVPLKCFDGDGIDDEGVRNYFVDLRKNQLKRQLGGSQNAAVGIKGVHFCPVVSELSWQDCYSEEDSSSASSDPSTDEISNRSLEEFCAMENEDEDFEIEEKSITDDKKKETSTLSLTEKDKEETFEDSARGSTFKESSPKRSVLEKSCDSSLAVREPSGSSDRQIADGSSGERMPHAEEKPVPPTFHSTPTSRGHVSVSDAAELKAERRTQLSVLESSLPAQHHANDNSREHDCFSSTNNVVATSTSMTTKKSKSRFGGFLERFSFRRFSGRRTSGGNSKKQTGKKDANKVKNLGACVTGPNGNDNGHGHEDVTIIPLHGPENEAEIKEIFRSVVSPHVISSKPPLPPNPQRMSGGSRKRSSPSGTASVGFQDVEASEKENMPGVRGNAPASDSGAASAALNSSRDDNNAKQRFGEDDKQVGLLETDLDTHITVESASRRPLQQCNVGSHKKARSLMNLGLGGLSVHHDQERESPSGFMETSAHRSHGSVAVDDRAKSMEFLLDKENQVAVLPPENELQKGGTGERIMSEHQLRVQRSLQKLNIPDWYKCSAVSQTPQGFLLKRNSDSRKENQGWPGLGSKTTSLSSLGSSQSAVARSPTYHLSSPSPTHHLFTRWSTSRLNSGLNSSSTSPSGSARSSFNYRQPYLGWRSQEKLTRPRTPAERLAAGLLPLQKHQTVAQHNNQASTNPNLTDVRTSIKEVTSAIVHYVSGVQENGSTEALRNHRAGASSSPSPKWQSSPRGSSGRLCWLESSFVGSRPLDQPETPLSLTESTSLKPDARSNDLYLDLKSHPQINNSVPHRLNESTSSEEHRFEKAIEVRTKPSPSSTTLDDILESLLGLPPTSRSPSPGPLSVASAAGSSPGKSRPLLPLPERQHHRHSWGDIRANVPGSASDPGNANFAKEVMMQRRMSDASDEAGLKRQGSAENKSKKLTENGGNGREEVNTREAHSNMGDVLVKCRYSKCGKTATVFDAKKTFKTCHNCSHVYCSRECRRAHWEKHRRTCLHSRVGALCRQVLSAAKDDPKALHHLSVLARRGYLTHGRGATKIFFSSPELAEKFVARGFDELGEPAYVKWSDLQPAEMGADLFAELMKICKSYNPDTRLVLYVAICVVSEVPTSGAVKWERQLVSRCCKLQLDKTLIPPKVEKKVPPPLPPRRSSSENAKITLEMENPDTLILTSLPGIAGKMPEQRVREISFTNIQRELKQRGVSLRRQFPEVYKNLCAYVEGTSDHFTPTTIYPKDSISGKMFMCIIMPDSEAAKLELVPKDSTRVQTVDVSVERKPVKPTT